jgi:adenosylcobinamide-phosphate synthase
MEFMAWQVAVAFLVDLIVGDPKGIPHPVVIIGKGISLLEKLLRLTIGRILGLRIAGIFLTLIIVGSSYGATWWIINKAKFWIPWVAIGLNIWLISTTIACNGLAKAAREIYDLLAAGNLEEARVKVGWIVGRDTQNLSPEELTRATVETVAENIVDGIIAPLFYAFIGGAPLAMAYRAINTLDSMVGYKNDKYLQFGWASARFDDLANYIPARITGLLLMIAGSLLKKDTPHGWKILKRDAKKHPSPNSGIPEAIVAGFLRIRLGGVNFYGGKESMRAYMGDPINELGKKHILEVNNLMQITACLGVLLGSFIKAPADIILKGTIY